MSSLNKHQIPLGPGPGIGTGTRIGSNERHTEHPQHKQQQQHQHCLVHRQVDKYDGQSIWINNREVYELGNYLGGGASGSVYQASDLNILPTERQVAIKILNPVGFKLFPVNQMNKCDVLRKGLPLSLEQHHGKATMMEDNIWWLYHPSSRQVLAAYEVWIPLPYGSLTAL